MKITKEDILKIAKIAHIDIEADEAEIFTKDFKEMLDFAEKLNELDTENIDLDNEETDNYNVFRKDEVKPSMAKKDLLANAPEEKNGCFFVPQIVE